MQGGKKGLLVNSRNICAHHYRARANMKGHNNRRNQFSPAMSNSRCNKKSRKRNHKRHARRAARAARASTVR